MLDLLLNPKTPLYALPIVAVLTPLLAFIAYRWERLELGCRPAVVLGATGPFAGLLWLFHGWALATIGFDSIFAALAVIGVASMVGITAGFWAGGGKTSG